MITISCTSPLTSPNESYIPNTTFGSDNSRQFKMFISNQRLATLHHPIKQELQKSKLNPPISRFFTLADFLLASIILTMKINKKGQ